MGTRQSGAHEARQAFQKTLTALIAAGAALVSAEVRDTLGTMGTPNGTGKRTATPKAEKGRRAQADVEALTETLFTYIKAHPWQTIEQIAEGMETTTTALARPLRKLKGFGAAGKKTGPNRLKAHGQKRATRYAVRGEKSAPPKVEKATPKKTAKKAPKAKQAASTKATTPKAPRAPRKTKAKPVATTPEESAPLRPEDESQVTPEFEEAPLSGLAHEHGTANAGEPEVEPLDGDAPTD